MKSKNWLYYGLVFIVWLIYAFLSFSAPQTDAGSQWGLTQTHITILKITIALPYLFIWLIALYGSLRLRNYAQTIKGSPESRGISGMSKGLILLLLSLIIPTILGAIRSHNTGATVPITIANNYVYAFVPLVAFYFFFNGSSQLLKSVTNHTVSISKKFLSLIPLALFSVVYVWLVFTNPNRQIAPSLTTTATYYLPDILIFLTIIIPSILGWGLGILSAVNISHVMKNTSGLIYKEALKFCVWGIVTVIIGSIIIQALLSLGTTRLLGVGIGPLLLIIYLFLAIQALGYILVGLGAKKLTRIETA